MNYIILNGIVSTSINGLLIQELPSITKPMIKNEIIEIDGKDSDFIDKKGYKNYDKIFTIGLKENYDINQIIKYFDFSGEVTFSNEPDKIYVCEVLDQIDFERLIKFKTAQVNFYTQSFKYLKDEPKTDETITTQTQINVTNQGLYASKPIITAYGTGSVDFTINLDANPTFNLKFDYDPNNVDQYLTIDSILEDCYKDDQKYLRNRSMTGEFPKLNPGENIITWSGNLTRIIIQPKSRWL